MGQDASDVCAMKIVPLLVLVSVVSFSVSRGDERSEYIADHSEAYGEVEAAMTLIHRALIDYMADHEGRWPVLDQDQIKSKDDLLQFWSNTLEPYGVPKKTWRHTNAKAGDSLSYILTMFDSEPLRAFEWSTQPWVITIGIADLNQCQLMPGGEIFISPFDSDKFPNGDDPNAPAVKPSPVPERLKHLRQQAE